MPLVRIDVIRGRDTEQVRTLLDTIHNAMVAALDVPATDRYQILTQHDPGDIVILQFTSRKRPEAAKADLYRRLAQSLQERCGVKATDLIVTITENGPADWSFGDGSAQFLTGAL
jgi:phenylpyruvate tautomerase PptA (4-oxalocrotonate tautomerase family)